MIIWFILLIVIGAIFAGIQATAEYGGIICIVIGVLLSLLFISDAKKNDKLCTVSLCAMFSANLYSLVSYFSSIKDILDGAGGFIDLFWCIFSGFMGNIVMFMLALLLLTIQEHIPTEHNKRALWNFLISTPIAFLLLFVVRNFFEY